MKKQKSESRLIGLVYGLCIVQVIYFMFYAYVTKDDDTGALSLFALILALEFFFLAGYAYSVIRRLLRLASASVLSLKNVGEASYVSSTFPEIDEALAEVEEDIKRERQTYEKKLQLITMCMETPVAADLFGKALPMILEITGADACAYYYVNNGTKKLELMESFGFSDKIYKSFDIEIGEGLEGGCCKSEKTRFLSEGEADEKYTYKVSYKKQAYQNVMAVPVKGNEGCVGVLSLAYKKSIQKKNIEEAEEVALLITPIHYNNSRYERYRRQRNEIKLQNTLIEDISVELKKKVEEIKELKDRISVLEDSGE